MSKLRLCVAGADSATTTGYIWDELLGYSVPFNQPTRFFNSFEAARDAANAWRDTWLEAGFHKTPANIYVKGSEWRLVFVVDEFGVQWRPV